MRKERFSGKQMLLAALAGAGTAVLVLAVGLMLILGPYVLTLAEGWGLIQSQFVGEYDPEQVIDSALAGMVSGTGDRWSYYLNAEGYAAQRQRRDNSYVGIGVTVELAEDRGLRVLEVHENSPAEKGGLKPGELLTAVDAVSLAGLSLEEATALIQGEDGTALTLTVQDPEGGQRSVELRREAMENVSVRYDLLPDEVGYIQVKNFYSHSADQLKAAVEDLTGQGARALIFDMRNNGGGYVDQLTDMLDYLLPEGPIFRSETKGGWESVTQSDEGCVDLPMVTLVNADTYSAAEIFAAQLQESVGAPIVGEPTSGKGYSQQAIPLPNGGALNLSTARYRTGGGVSLIGTGVSLDKKVSLGEKESNLLAAGALAYEEDAQLQAAMDFLTP